MKHETRSMKRTVDVKLSLLRGSRGCSYLLAVASLLSFSTAFVVRKPSTEIRLSETRPLADDADASLAAMARILRCNGKPNKNLHLLTCRLSKRSSEEGGDGDGSWTDGGRISVTVEEEIPSVSDAATVREAWLEHHWKRGGGLPIYVSLKDDDDHNALRRVVMPIMMEEEATIKRDENFPSSAIEYTVTKPGWAFQSDLVDGSHVGSVSFIPAENGPGCKMIWKVEFDAVRFRGLYQAVTKFTIGTAARTVAESLSEPRLLTVKSNLNVPDPIDARREWLEFFWARGGGLPLPPPISRGEILEEGGGSARRSIVRVPPLLVDTVLSTTNTEDSAQALYQIENPGWTTFPFLIHTHLGRIRFDRSSTLTGGEDGEGERDDAGVDITWEIEVRPFRLVAPLVEMLLEMTASTIVRNLVVHFAEPGATVEIRPPRGNANLAGGIDRFGSVPKDIWLGGVLDAHLKDDRSTVQQTLSMVQPWSWGRTGSGDEEDNVTFGWSDTSMVL
eukprot:CAMPEP_0172530312 /NCGR_PEP_ID=MMETSP1067-20121228/4079_1 /TAXON_ID=265564 ORGANISM="Thalassiosira punctigera, Strain Tpunct2005C2" /NCGR_SAMPLE_ID=MMETSP1067 /ASSEMBLY_ACC=CAM_ASM_000444 /LENGTH=503 /DNA_ID=CAMNT_0013314489 /DNA_START=243 /DNA_END=1754 /DNA_ORIENTATION=-